MATSKELLLAILSMDSYNRSYDVGLNVTGSVVGNAIVGVDSQVFDADQNTENRIDVAASFYAASYTINDNSVDDLTSGTKIISYRGTDNLASDSWVDTPTTDVWNGYGTAIGSTMNDQAHLAANFYQEVTGTTAGDPSSGSAILTGHSLGGGLAGFVGAIYGQEAVVFDNMPFELAASKAFVNAVLGDLDPLNWFYGLFFDDFYNGLTPTNVTIGDDITAHAVAGEMLDSARTLQSTDENYLESHSNLDSVQLHSQALLVVLTFAKDNLHTSWQPFGNILMDTLFDEKLAEFNNYDKEDVNGHYSAAYKQLTTLAYSALDEGGLVFGNTGVWSLFNDADDLGEVFNTTAGANSFLTSLVFGGSEIGGVLRVQQTLTNMIVQFSSTLAKNKIEKGDNSEVDVRQGILEVAQDGETFSLDLSNIVWDSAEQGLQAIDRNNFIDNYFAKANTGNFNMEILASSIWNGGLEIYDRIHIDIKETVTDTNLADRSYEVSGTDHVDLYIASNAANELEGTAGNDLIFANGGNDVFVNTTGVDVLDGGVGLDTANYIDDINGVTLHIEDGAEGTYKVAVGDDGDNADYLKSVEKIVLGDGDDKVEIKGIILQEGELLARNEYDIELGGGDDHIVVNASDVTVYAGTGDDYIDTSVSAGVTVYSGEGADYIVLGNNTLVEDARNEDRFVYAGQVLKGGMRWESSEDVYAYGLGGLIRFGNNNDGQLIIEHRLFNAEGWEAGAKWAQTFVSGAINSLNDAVGELTGNMFIYAMEWDAKRIFELEAGEHEASLEALRQLIKYIDVTLEIGNSDPLVLDLDGDGIELSSRFAHDFMYDIDGDGFKEATGWVRGDDGFLVVDENQNGKIDNVAEMFGGIDGQSGFEELSTHDANADNVIDANDAIYSDLKVWQDFNNNGVTDAGELSTLSDLGIASISLNNVADGQEVVTNIIDGTSSFTYTDGTTSTIADVIFTADNFDSQWADDIAISSTTDALPNLLGHGIMTNLHESIELSKLARDNFVAANPGTDPNSIETLQDILNANYGNLGTHILTDLVDASEDIINAWATVSIDKTSTGALDANNFEGLYDLHVLVERNIYGIEVVDIIFPITDPVTQVEYWSTKSNSVIQDDLGFPIQQPTHAEVLNHMVTGDTEWEIVTVAEQQFIQRYYGEEINLSAAITAGENAMTGLSGIVELVLEQKELLAVKLAMQGPLANEFAGLSYDFETDTFVTTTEFELAPLFKSIFAEAVATTGVAYIEEWKPILNVIFSNYIRDEGRETNYSYVFRNIVSAYEETPLEVDIKAVTEIFGFDADQVIVGTGTMVGDAEDNIFYMGAGDQIAQGGKGFDSYIFGSNFGNDVIDDTEYTTYEDELRFAELTSDQVTFSRNGIDLIISVIGATDTITINEQFIGKKPGLFGGQLLPERGIERFIFADGEIWDEFDVAYAVSDPTSADQTIDGTDATDVLDGGAGDDTLIGKGGSDVYIFDRGYGNDVAIDEELTYLTNDMDVLAFGEDIGIDDVTFSRNGSDDDLVISINDTLETFTITNQFTSWYTLFGQLWYYRIEVLSFTDGTILSPIDVMKTILEEAKTVGDDIIYGFDVDDVLNGGAGNDYLSGGNENDTYIFGVNYGQDIVAELVSNVTSGATDKVVFIDGIAPEDLVLTKVGDNLEITFLNSTDKLTIEKQFSWGGLGYGSFDEIETFEFSDGTVWTAHEVRVMLLEDTDGDDYLIGFHTPDIFLNGVGNDHMSGRDGDDVYHYNIGDGVDTIDDDLKIVSYSNVDKIIFGDLVDPANVVLTHDGSHLTMSFIGSSDQLIVQNQFNYGGLGYGSYDEIEFYEFNDGTVWTANDVRLKLLESTSGNDNLVGFHTNDIIAGGLGDDTLVGRDGDDTYIYNLGDGHDTIEEKVQVVDYSNADKVIFGAGITLANMIISAPASDIVITFTNDAGSLTVLDQFSNSYKQIEEYVFDDGSVLTRTELLSHQIVEPTAGDDVLVGTASDDVISSLAGNDTITGLAGDDELNGGSGDDILEGGAGDDILNGSSGSDTYYYSSGEGNDFLNDDNFSTTQTDKLIFSDLNVADIQLSHTGTDLFITVLATSEVIEVNDQFALAAFNFGLEEIEFADGTIWVRDEIRAQSIIQMQTDGDDVVNGSKRADVFEGGLGDDVLNGDAGSDTYYYSNGDGNDFLNDDYFSTTQTDILIFRDLNAADVQLSRTGNNLIVTIVSSGEQIEVNNQFALASFNYGLETIEFADGTNWTRGNFQQIIDGSSSSSDIVGTNGNDSLTGTDLDDTFIGGLGDDNIDSRIGSDTFIYASGDGNDYINEENGSTVSIDKLKLTDLNPEDIILRRSGVDLFVKIIATGEEIEIDEQFYSTASNWGIEEIEFANGTIWDRSDIGNNLQIIGTNANDSLTGYNGDEVFIGGLGDDNIDSRVGSDTFIYALGDGNDYINEENGSTVYVDVLKLIDINSDEVTLRRSGVDLFIKINATGDEIEIDEQFYSASSNWGIEQIQFADGVVWDRADLIEKAWLRGTDGVDNMTGLNGNDTFYAGLGDDNIDSRSGSDTFIYASGDGNDYIDEENGSTVAIDVLKFIDLNPEDISMRRSGADLFIKIIPTGEEIEIDEQFYSNYSNWGIEQIQFADGTMWTRAEIKAQIIDGTSANNVLSGTIGNDFITALAGDDTLNGNDGDDTLNGGEGADILDGGVGTDTASYQDASTGVNVHMLDIAQNTGEAAGDSYISIESLRGSNFGDTLIASDDDNFIWAGDGNDTILGLDGDDTIFGGSGNDDMYGNEGNDTISGGDGDDVVFGYEDDDIITLGDGDDYAIGGSGNDSITGDAGDDEIYGHAGNDTLIGGIGADIVFGDDGDDHIDLGDGNDFAVGGAGNDTFVFRSGLGNDVISDFQGGAGVSDVIELESMGISSYAQLQSYMSEWSGTTYIDFDANNSITLEGVAMANLDADDFNFA